MLVDSHCHLDYPEFESELPALVKRADEAGVKMMLTISVTLEKFPNVLKVAETYDNIYCTVGIHPNEAETVTDDATEKLIKFSQHPKVVGIGETGLDYFYETSDRDIQRKSFLQHIKACQETGLPIIIHSRDAEEDTASILREHMELKPFKGLLHCFTSSKWLADQAINLGFLISFSGILTFKNAKELHDTAAQLSMDHLLVETDAPYLAPMPHRGERNEPAYTRHTAKKLADLQNLTLEEVGQKTSKNFFDLFDKIPSEMRSCVLPS